MEHESWCLAGGGSREAGPGPGDTEDAEDSATCQHRIKDLYTQPTLRTEVRWPPSSKPLPKPQAERTPETSSKKESTIFDENIKILGALCRYKYE